MERRLTIIQGDLTLLPLRDGAIINPSNTGMILTNRGIGQQLLRRAGPFIQQTLHTERSRLRGGRLDPGHVLATDAGQLQADKLIHIAVVGGRKVNTRLIARGLLNAYDMADEIGMTALGIPPIGPGISKLTMEEFLDVFWRITSEEFPRLENVVDIFLCADTDEEFQQMKAYASEHLDELPEGVSLDVSEEGISLSMFSAQFQ